MPILAQELPHSPRPSPSGAGSAARESRQRGRAASAYCRVPQTLRRPAITYRLSCVKTLDAEASSNILVDGDQR